MRRGRSHGPGGQRMMSAGTGCPHPSQPGHHLGPRTAARRRPASLITQITRIAALWPAMPNGNDMRRIGGSRSQCRSRSVIAGQCRLRFPELNDVAVRLAAATPGGTAVQPGAGYLAAPVTSAATV
jgi:hypothetical protein